MFIDYNQKNTQTILPSQSRLRLVQTFVRSVSHLTKDTFILTTSRNGMDFMPGQRVRINMKDDPVARWYSIYSGTASHDLEFLIHEVPNGHLTPKLKSLQPGDEIELVGPKGKFVLGENLLPETKYLFVATGTGIAPFHSMIKSFPGLNYKLLHGISRIDEAYDHAHFQRKRLVVCTSKDHYGDVHGRVTHYLSDDKERYDRIFLCGNKTMIRDVIGLLKQRGYDERSLHSEVYY